MIAAFFGYKYGHSNACQLEMETKCHPQYYERIMKLEKESSSCSSQHELLLEGCTECKEKLQKCQVDFENIREEYTKVIMKLEKESSSCSSRQESLLEGCTECKEKLHKCQVDFENIREEYTKVRIDLTECRTASELRRITDKTNSNNEYSKLEKKLGDCRQALESCSKNAGWF